MNRKFNRFVKAVFLAASCVVTTAAQDSTAFNLNMDQVDSGADLPKGWSKMGGSSVTVETDGKSPKNRYLKIASGPDSRLGVVRYFIPATRTQETISLTGKIKAENVGRRGGARLRIVFFKNGQRIGHKASKAVVGTTEWNEYSVSSQVPNGTDQIALVGFLVGKGTAWFDDFRLTKPTENESQFGAESDHEFDKGSGVSDVPVNNNSLTEIDRLGRVWGYVKYHHPTVISGKVNWDYELFRILPKYLAAISIEERCDALAAWIDGLGEFETVTNSPVAHTDQYRLQPDLDWIERVPSGKLQRMLKSLQHAKRPDDNYYVGSHPGAGNPRFNEQPYAQFEYPDVGFRLLSLFRYWNIIQYYFPYRTLTDKDWNDVLTEFIPRFVLAKNALEYQLAATELIAAVQDTHAQVFGPNEIMAAFRGKNQGVLQLRFVEGELAVTGFVDVAFADQEDIEIGDVITEIDGVSVKMWLGDNERYFPASNRAAQLRIIAENILRTNRSDLTIKVRRGNESLSRKIPCLAVQQIRKNFHSQKKARKHWEALDGNIGYLYPGTITAEDVRRLPRRLQGKKGLIVDLRCYPSQFIVFSVGAMLMPEATEFVKFTKPASDQPGAFEYLGPLKVGKHNANYFRGKIAVLVDERTLSQAEYTAMALRVAPNARVFGSTTAGADGNVSRITLPGNINTAISGLGVYTPDGHETQRVGIVPDVLVKPTIEEIRSGKDVVLEKALEWIRSEEHR